MGLATILTLPISDSKFESYISPHLHSRNHLMYLLQLFAQTRLNLHRYGNNLQLLCQVSNDLLNQEQVRVQKNLAYISANVWSRGKLLSSFVFEINLAVILCISQTINLIGKPKLSNHTKCKLLNDYFLFPLLPHVCNTSA